MPNPSKAPAPKSKKSRFKIGRYQLGVVFEKTNPLKPKFPVGSKVTIKSETLGKDYPPLTGTVKGYENGKKLLVSFNGGGTTAIKPNQLQPHYAIGKKPVAIKATPIK